MTSHPRLRRPHRTRCCLYECTHSLSQFRRRRRRHRSCARRSTRPKSTLRSLLLYDDAALSYYFRRLPPGRLDCFDHSSSRSFSVDWFHFYPADHFHSQMMLHSLVLKASPPTRCSRTYYSRWTVLSPVTSRTRSRTPRPPPLSTFPPFPLSFSTRSLSRQSHPSNALPPSLSSAPSLLLSVESLSAPTSPCENKTVSSPLAPFSVTGETPSPFSFSSLPEWSVLLIPSCSNLSRILTRSLPEVSSARRAFFARNRTSCSSSLGRMLNFWRSFVRRRWTIWTQTTSWTTSCSCWTRSIVRLYSPLRRRRSNFSSSSSSFMFRFRWLR